MTNRLNIPVALGALLVVLVAVVGGASAPQSAGQAPAQAASPPAVVQSGAPPASPPGLPASFYGTATLDSRDAPVGSLVSAWIDGVKYAERPVVAYQGRAYYALDVPADDPATAQVEGGRAGDTIVFRFGAAPATQTAIWRGGSNSRLDLIAASS
jgi:hypothetical protein